MMYYGLFDLVHFACEDSCTKQIYWNEIITDTCQYCNFGIALLIIFKQKTSILSDLTFYLKI